MECKASFFGTVSIGRLTPGRYGNNIHFYGDLRKGARVPEAAARASTKWRALHQGCLVVQLTSEDKKAQ